MIDTQATTERGAARPDEPAPAGPQIDSNDHPEHEVVCRECSGGADATARTAWAAERPRLERHLSRLRRGERRYRVVVHERHPSFEVRLTLALRGATLAARAESERLPTALGEAVARLERELIRHLTQQGGEQLQRRLRRRRADLAAAAPALAADKRRGDRASFIEALRPYLPQLRELARHEIRIAQLEGRLYPGELTVGDLLDDLLSRAWDQFDVRVAALTLDRWLVRMLHEAADDLLRRHEPPRSRRLDAVDAHLEAVDDGWATEEEPFATDPEPASLQALLTESVEAGPAAVVSAREVHALVLDVLRGFPAEQRRSFVLAAYDGWTEEEIAMLLGKSPDEVRSVLAAIRARIRERVADHVGAAGRPAPPPSGDRAAAHGPS